MGKNDAYIDMDINVLKQYIEADPESISYIYKMLQYRNLRTEQVYYAELAYRYDHPSFGRKDPKEVAEAGELTRSYWKDRLYSLDRDRRDTHNGALAAFNKFVEIGQKNGLDYIYIGPLLTSKEAYNYEKSNNRATITNAMFSLLSSIEDYAFVSTMDQNSKDEDILEIKKNMNRFNRSFNVKSSIEEDENMEDKGGIEFYDMLGAFNSDDIQA